MLTRVMPVSLIMVVGCAALLKHESASDKQDYKHLKEVEAAAEELPDGDDCTAWSKKWKARYNVELKAQEITRGSSCTEHGSLDSCQNAVQIESKAKHARTKMLKDGLANENPALDSSCLRTALLEAYTDPALAKGIDVTKEIETVAARQVKYWKDEIKKVSSFRDWVKRESEGICFTSTAPSPDKSPNASNLALVFPTESGSDDEIYVRCVLPQSIASYPRDEGDYVELVYWHGTEKTGFSHKVPVDGQPSKDTYEFSISSNALKKAYDKMRKKNGNTGKYEDPYYLVLAQYVVSTKTGKRDVYSGGTFIRSEEVMEHQAKAEGSFFLRASK
jgi:hypothetical protein